MKSLKIWSLVALLAMALVSCGDDIEVNGGNNGGNNGGDNGGDNGGGDVPIINTDIVGEWHLISWCDAEPEFDVYIEFNKYGKFNIYQQTWTFTYDRFTGTFSVNDTLLSGMYSDGSSWIASYIHTVEDSKLTLINTVDLDEVGIYEACVIPAEVIEEATTTRAEETLPFL